MFLCLIFIFIILHVYVKSALKSRLKFNAYAKKNENMTAKFAFITLSTKHE